MLLSHSRCRTERSLTALLVSLPMIAGIAGTALLSFPIYYGSRYGQGQYREFFQAIPASDELSRSVHYNDCIARNRAKTSRFLSLSGSRSPTLAAIGADLRR